MKEVQLQITVVIEPDGQQYHAYCPALKGLHASGGTEEEAFNGAREAASMYLKSLVKHNDPIPVSQDGGSRDAGEKVHIPATATRRQVQVSCPIAEPEPTGKK